MERTLDGRFRDLGFSLVPEGYRWLRGCIGNGTVLPMKWLICVE